MTGTFPYVVALAAAARQVGRSTLAANLAVYLKGLNEDLPVAVLSFDTGFDPAEKFSLPGNPAPDCGQFLPGEGLESRFCLGQFGVDYLESGILPDLTPAEFRQLIRNSRYPGILIIDAGPPGKNSSTVALQTADLVLAPLRNAAGLSALADIRREMKAGGGDDRMLWLIPAMIDDPQDQARQLKLLRFAARERDCQVLDAEFVVEEDLPELTRGCAGSVLTRMPGSSAHHLIYKLAKLVLDKYRSGIDSDCHLRRLQMDSALPPRFRRVDVICPLCDELACFSVAHYCEALPQRQRWLVHEDCFTRLLDGRKLKPFWLKGQTAVLRTGVESTNLIPQLRLVLPDSEGEYFESELFQPVVGSGWQALVKRATGKTLAEQFPAAIMIYPAVSGRKVLTESWYRSCVALRKRLREGLASE